MTRCLRLTASALVLLLACEVDDDDSPGDAETGDPTTTAATTPGSSTTGDSGQTSVADATGEGPSPDAERQCKTTCDSLLDTDCITVNEHESCFLDCGVRSDDEIELFRSCWLNTVNCDDEQQCLANFLDDETPDPTGDPDPETCLDACNIYIGMGCSPPIEGVTSCAEFCGDLSAELQAAAVICLAGADGCTLPEGCVLPGE